jgi:predicted amidohydrolase
MPLTRFPEPSLLLRQASADILTYPSAFTPKTGEAHWGSFSVVVICFSRVILMLRNPFRGTAACAGNRNTVLRDCGCTGRWGTFPRPAFVRTRDHRRSLGKSRRSLSATLDRARVRHRRHRPGHPGTRENRDALVGAAQERRVRACCKSISMKSEVKKVT